MVLGYVFFYVCRITFSSIDFALISRRCWYHVWWLFDTFPLSHATCKTFWKQCYYNGFTGFIRKHDLWWCSWFLSLPVLELIFDILGNRFCFHVGTPLLSNSMCSTTIFVDDFGEGIFCWFWSKKVPISSLGTFPFLLLFLTVTALVPQSVFWDVPWLILAPFRLPFQVCGIFSNPLLHWKPFFSTPESVKHP